MIITKKKKWLGTFQLIMFAVVSVDSLRNLPIGAQYGLSLVTFYSFAGLAFFLPLVWVASQLTVKFPNVGGSYLWIQEAFGETWGCLSIWLQWTYNIIWYPTIFAFITSTLISLISPELGTNKFILLSSCAGLFWLITFIHSFGIKASSWFSAISAIVGTLLPMTLIIVFAIYWMLSGSPSATPLTIQGLLPGKETLKNLAYFSNILFSLLGLEVIAMHAGNVANPKKSYPRAFFISAIIILTTLILSSLALCIVIPPGKIMLLSGMMDVFNLFFATHHFPYGATIIGWCIVIGGLGIASSWMIGLARGLHTALTSANVFKALHPLNSNGVAINVLCFQGVVYTLLLSAFLLLPNINSSYWLLSALSAQFSLIYYVLLFSAAFKLFRSTQQLQTFLSKAMPISAGIVSLMGIAVGFIPPTDISQDNILSYEFFMISSLFIFCIIPFFVLKIKTRKKYAWNLDSSKQMDSEAEAK